MLPPTLKSEPASQQPGGDVRGDQRRLDHDRPGTAHRINEGPAAGRDLGPAATQQQRSGEIFLERRFEGRLAVATLVQRPAGEVDPDRSAVATESHAHAQIGIIEIHRRSHAVTLAEAIDDRILGLLRGEGRAAHQAGASPTTSTAMLPSASTCSYWQRADETVELLGIRRWPDASESTMRSRSANADRLAGRARASPRTRPRGMRARHLHTERSQLAGKELRDMTRAGREELAARYRGLGAHASGPRAGRGMQARASTRRSQRVRMR